jgi:hypothetical protein
MEHTMYGFRAAVFSGAKKSSRKMKKPLALFLKLGSLVVFFGRGIETEKTN